MTRQSEDRGVAILASLAIKPVGLDDYAHVRHVHATALRLLAGSHMAEAEIDAFVAHVRSADYSDKLMRMDLHAGWVGSEMVGTAAWSAADDSGGSARIQAVFVRPPFAKLGLGRRLVTHVEMLARAAGFGALSVRATVNTVGFFERIGYQVVSHGQQNLTPELPLPVAFMRKWEGTAIPRRATKSLHEIH